MDQALTGEKTVTVAGGSESETDLQSELGSPVDGNVQGESPVKDFARDDSADQELSEEGSYRETIRGVKSFMGWHQIPDFDSASSSLDDNPFASSRAQPTWKVSIKLPVDDCLCRKVEKLNLTISEGYPSRNTETAGLLRDQFVKPPRSSRWYDMHTVKKDYGRSTVCSGSPEPAKLNSAFSRATRTTGHSLSSAPASWEITQDTLRHWERSAREQTVMCNQAAGISRCLSKVQDSMVAQLKTLHLDKGNGKASERTACCR